MSRIPLIYHTNIKFYTQYTHPTLICRGTDAHTDGWTDTIYSIFRDKLLLLGEHVKQANMGFAAEAGFFGREGKGAFRPKKGCIAPSASYGFPRKKNPPQAQYVL